MIRRLIGFFPWGRMRVWARSSLAGPYSPIFSCLEGRLSAYVRNQLADDPVSDKDIYFNSTCLWTESAGATASLVFQGTEIYLYSAKSPQGGRMNVTCDWNSTAIPLYESELQGGEMVWHATGLDPTILHVLKVELIDGRINIDKVGVTPGPQSALPPGIPSPVPPGMFSIIVDQ